MATRWTGLFVAFALVTFASTASATTISFEFANVTGARVAFGGGNFTFLDGPSGFDFTITESDTTPALAGLQGNIDGTYQIGTVTPDGSGSIASVTTVSATSKFRVYDGVSAYFSADLSFVDVAQSGTGGTLNTQGTVNLTNLSYAGSNAALLSLASYPDAIVSATFQFVPARTLAQLKAQSASSPLKTSYSGSLYSTSLPDGGATATLLGLAMLGFGALRSRLMP